MEEYGYLDIFLHVCHLSGVSMIFNAKLQLLIVFDSKAEWKKSLLSMV